MTTFADYKRDDRPAVRMWAPGSYRNTCCDCKAAFIGDKRALQCADCAYGPPKPPMYFHHIAAWMIEQFSQRWNRKSP